MKYFGPTFADELRAAGLSDGITWNINTGEIFGWEDLSPQIRAALDTLIAVHNPEAAADAPIPQEVSDRQLAAALAQGGHISWDEAKAWVGPGVIPAALAEIVSNLPSPDKEHAELMLIGATTYKRLHPVTTQLAVGMGWSAEQVDDLWRLASTL